MIRVIADVVYSPDDGGWYAEVYGLAEDGIGQKDYFTTDLQETCEDAKSAAIHMARERSLLIVGWTIVD